MFRRYHCQNRNSIQTKAFIRCFYFSWKKEHETSTDFEFDICIFISSTSCTMIWFMSVSELVILMDHQWWYKRHFFLAACVAKKSIVVVFRSFYFTACAPLYGWIGQSVCPSVHFSIHVCVRPYAFGSFCPSVCSFVRSSIRHPPIRVFGASRV